jgi:DNA-binding GntR family transcriptional regulator
MRPTSDSQTLADHAYELLLDRLVMLKIPPGAPISESAVAVEFGLGRTPIREALKRLETDHLVEFFPRRGTFATRADLGDLKSITEMRVILEPAGVRDAAENADEAGRHGLRTLAAELGDLMAAEPTDGTLLEYDLAVHRAIYRLVGNRFMREVLFRLDNQATRLWWSVIQHVPSVGDHVDGHRALLRAVADGNADGAADMAREHVTEFHEQLRQALVDSATIAPVSG